MPISVVIPVRNEGRRIVKTVHSIVSGRSSHFPLEIVIVDDASTDGACDDIGQITRGVPEVTLVVQRLNQWSGIPYARNRGVEATSYSLLVITDGNTKFPSNWDAPIRRHFDKRRIVAATIADMASSFCGYGCTLVLPSMGVTWLPIPNAYGGYVPVAACTCTVIDRTLFHHLGGYDESLPLYGAAEPEFSVRAWLSGFEIVNVPNLVISHRFRPEKERELFHSSNSSILLPNYLRFACYYLPEQLLMRSYRYFSELMRDDFEPCLARLEAEGVWARREQLKGFPRDFKWFIRKFRLMENCN